MELTPAEGRVLACLIEKQVGGPEAYSLTLDELRFACNQTSGRRTAVTYDDRVVVETLLSLKSKGLAKFVPAGQGTREVRYRHCADERWRLSLQEQTVLASLLLHGPQTAAEVFASVPAGSPIEVRSEVEAVLDALAGRTPTPFATRMGSKGRGTDVRWAEVLTGRPEQLEQLELAEMGSERDPEDQSPRPPPRAPMPPVATGTTSGPSPLTMVELADRLSGIERRLAGIETELGFLRQVLEDRGAADPASRVRS